MVGSEDHTAGGWPGVLSLTRILTETDGGPAQHRDLRSAGVKTQLKGILAKYTSVLSG